MPVKETLESFKTFTHAYTEVEGHPILADIAVPKSLLDEGPQSETWKTKRPVLVRIHGGFLIGGRRDIGTFCPIWLLQLALNHGAIVVAPDYRFLPEFTAEDILDDIDAFWSWFEREFPRILENDTSSEEVGEKGLQADLSNVIVAGESAGGYLATQLALSHARDQYPCIRALIAIYPMLDLRSPHWTQAYRKQIFDAPQFPSSLIDDFLSKLAKPPSKPIITNDLMVDSGRFELAMALVQHGRFLETMGKDRDPSPGKRRIHPEDRLEDGAKLPPTFFVHGIQDGAVPVGGTDKFMELVTKYGSIDGLKDGAEVMHYVRVPGDHAFDMELKQDALWVKDGFNFLSRYWPVHDLLVPN